MIAISPAIINGGSKRFVLSSLLSQETSLTALREMKASGGKEVRFSKVAFIVMLWIGEFCCFV